MSLRLLIPGLCAAAALFLFPSHVLAWGPVAHLDFAGQLLAGVIPLAPVLMDLITKHADDFLYGNLAADVILGKNRAQDHDQCHSWDVARKLLVRARLQGPGQEAFMLGYMAHLGADVVAHNHIVPQMMVIHYSKNRAGHLYWEARADQRLLDLDPGLVEIWKEIMNRRFWDHDAFLAEELVPTLFSNKLSARIYKQGLRMQRKAVWRRAFRRIDVRSKLLFDQDDLLRWRKLAVVAAHKAIDNPTSAQLDHLDPTGKAALKRAVYWRKALRRKLRNTRRNPSGKLLLLGAYDRALLETRMVNINMFDDEF